MRTWTVRPARPGDEPALVRIHDDMGAYYAELAPDHFHRPRLDRYADELRAELADDDPDALRLVAELDGAVIAALDAPLLLPPAGSEHAFTIDLATPRLRIDYLATAAAHRRSGAGSLLVEAAEAWG